jgi:enoyl-CoA hydratase/carnithine racemase
MKTSDGFETLEVRLDDGVLCVELARPERVNAINKRMCAELAQVVARAGADAKVRVVFTAAAARVCAARHRSSRPTPR